MTAMELQHCPGPETLASFVEGTLPRAEVAAVIRHLQGCAECRAIVGDVVEFQRNEAAALDAEESEPAPLRSRRWWLPAAAAAVLVIAIGSGVVVARQRDPFRVLIAASPTSSRPVEARLSADFPWAASPDFRGGDDPLPLSERNRLDRAAGEVVKGNRGKDTATALHAVGVARLLAGEKQAGLEDLRKAAAKAPDDARILNDLVVAYVETGRLQDALDLTRGLLQREPKSLPARFNEALLLEKLGRDREAVTAWRHYMTLDGTSAWADEARERVRDLGQ